MGTLILKKSHCEDLTSLWGQNTSPHNVYHSILGLRLGLRSDLGHGSGKGRIRHVVIMVTVGFTPQNINESLCYVP